MISHTIVVRDRRITSVDPQVLVQGCHNVDEIVLDLDDEWNSLSIIVYIGFGKWLRAAVYDGSPLVVDVDFPPGFIPVSIVGEDKNTGRKLTTVKKNRGFRVVTSGGVR